MDASSVLTTVAHGPVFDIVIRHNGDMIISTEICYKPDRRKTGNITNNSPDDIKEQLEDYLNGKKVNFKARIISPDLTRFGMDIVRALVKVPYGQTVSYGELASRAGHSKAARATGSVMRKHHIPIIIPCHRVVAGNGLGSYSAEKGIFTKKVLLTLENAI